MSSNVDFAKVSAGIGGPVDFDHPCRSGAQILDAEAGLIERRRDKVAIVGYATSSRDVAPFDDPDYEIIGLNQLYRLIPRADIWADTHAYWEEFNVEGTDHRGWIRDAQIPVLMTEHHPDLPMSVRFPIERCIEVGTDYFTSTISHLVAWAIVQGYKEIALYGIDLVVGTEYECVAPDTRVLTADLRWMPAGMLRVGDCLVGFDEHGRERAGTSRLGRRYQTATVTGADRITKPCSRVTMMDGTKMVVSSDHPWLVKTGKAYRWLRTDQLQGRARGNGASRIVKITDVWGQPVHSWDAGYLAAAFDGEGHLSGPLGRVGTLGNLAYSQCDNAMADAVKSALAVYVFKWTKHSGRGRADNSCHTYLVSGGRTETMRFLGQMRPQRVLDLFSPDHLGRMHAKAAVPVVSVESVGDREVVALGTSSGTFVAEGFASHNSQKACAEFWLGLAHGRGITVRLPPVCALLKHTHRYGYEREPDWWPSRRTEITGRHAELLKQRDLLIKKLHALDGALHEVSTREKWVTDPEAREQWLRERHSQSQLDLATVDGAAQETYFWLQTYDMRSRGVGDRLVREEKKP